MGYDIDLNLKCECYKQAFHSKFLRVLFQFGGFENSRGQYEFGPHALDFIKDIGHRIVESTGEKRSTSYVMQTIGMAIQCGTSSCILETVVDSRKLDEVYYL